MQRIDNLSKWRELAPGEVLEFDRKGHRKIKVEVNAPQETRLYVEKPGGPVKFIALVKGRDTISFAIDGKYSLHCDATIWMHASEMETSHGPASADKFTKIMQRQPRNYEMELMQRRVMENVNKRLDAQAGEYEKALKAERQRTQAALKAKEAKDDAKADDKSKGGQGVDPEASGAGEKGKSASAGGEPDGKAKAGKD